MRWISSAVIIVVLFSCNKEKPDPIVEVDSLSNSMFVLCEGLFQQNNSEVTYIDLSNASTSNNFFEQRTNRALGDTGNDLIKYGGKIYIAVNVSSTIEVLQASDFSSLKQISMIQGNQAKQPRYLKAFGDKVYVSCYDGFVDVIDTLTLTVTARIPVGTNPEGMAISNGKLYVANSGGLNYPNMDSTISVIDLNLNVELQKINAGLNPGDVEVDDLGNVFVVCRGDYNSVAPSLVRIDPTTDQISNTYALPVSEMTRFTSGRLLLAYNDFSGGSNQVGVFDVSAGSITTAQLLNLTDVTSVYDIQFDPVSNKIYLCDAMNFTTTGYVHVFDFNGTKLNSYHVGLNPTKVLVYE